MTSQIQKNRQEFLLDGWARRYFDIDGDGTLVACLPAADASLDQDAQAQRFRITDLVDQAVEQGGALPMLLCFEDIIVSQVRQLAAAFDRAIVAHQYPSRYRPAYPIKVNQSRYVVDTVAGSLDACALECGSKAELLATLASAAPGSLIICNGVKDTAYLTLAMSANQLDLSVIIVVEKLSELARISQISRQQDLRPRLGLRLRLASVAGGKWQNSGGVRAKFGFTPEGFFTAIDRLKADDLTDCLEMIHFHPGSQVSDLGHVRRAIRETVPYLKSLQDLGIEIRYLNAGGGLGLDYQGNQSSAYFSVNYDFDQYAECIVTEVSSACEHHGLVHPVLVTESGRALTAHHAVLITEVSEAELAQTAQVIEPAPGKLSGQFDALLGQSGQLTDEELLSRIDAQYQTGLKAFVDGQMSLNERRLLDREYQQCLVAVAGQTVIDTQTETGLLVHDRLLQMSTGKYFVNFSVFRSIPDSWAIEQIFPIVPLNRLDEAVTVPVVLEDITCDSDGRVDQYISEQGPREYALLHPLRNDAAYLLGVFMVGAYQEILGDNHNLLGLTDLVRVRVSDGSAELMLQRRGQKVADVLQDAGYPRPYLMDALAARADALDPPSREAFMTRVSGYLDQSSYPTDPVP